MGGGLSFFPSGDMFSTNPDGTVSISPVPGPPAPDISAGDVSANPTAGSQFNVNSILQLGSGIAADIGNIVRSIRTPPILPPGSERLPGAPAVYTAGPANSSQALALSGSLPYLLIGAVLIIVVVLIAKK